jgi:quercetin dioxygenase-like cupin family protein
MAWKTIAAAAAAGALVAGCDAGPAAQARNEAATVAPAAPTAVAAAAAVAQDRFDETMSGQPLNRPPTPFQLSVTRLDLPPGHVIPCHRHTHPRYVYVQQGNLEVTNHDVGKVYEFEEGDVAVESIGQWHQGLVTSKEERTILVAFEQVPPGGDNSTPCPPKPAP